MENQKHDPERFVAPRRRSRPRGAGTAAKGCEPPVPDGPASSAILPSCATWTGPRIRAAIMKGRVRCQPGTPRSRRQSGNGDITSTPISARSQSRPSARGEDHLAGESRVRLPRGAERAAPMRPACGAARIVRAGANRVGGACYQLSKAQTSGRSRWTIRTGTPVQRLLLADATLRAAMLSCCAGSARATRTRWPRSTASTEGSCSPRCYW